MAFNLKKAIAVCAIGTAVALFSGSAQANPIGGQVSALGTAAGSGETSRLIQHVQFRRGGFRRGRGFRRGGFRGRRFGRRGGFRRGRGFRRGGFRGRRFGRRGFRGRRFGRGFGVGIGTGLLLGTAFAAPYYYSPRARFSGGACGSFGIGTAAYHDCCFSKYKSYDASSRTYLAFSGRRRFCR